VGGGNANVILATSPSELPIANAIAAASLLCPNAKGIGRLHLTATMNNGNPLSIGALKRIVARSSLMLCNDTGPRHFAAALQIPTVTLFGPTDPIWAQTYSTNEKILRLPVPCGPCQLKQCPIDHRCMKDLTTEMVYNALKEMLQTPQQQTPEPDIDPRTLDDASTTDSMIQ
jgi:heptosyltransferase II